MISQHHTKPNATCYPQIPSFSYYLLFCWSKSEDMCVQTD